MSRGSIKLWMTGLCFALLYCTVLCCLFIDGGSWVLVQYECHFRAPPPKFTIIVILIIITQ